MQFLSIIKAWIPSFDGMTARDRRGFTLIEILIVLAISAMLSAIAIGYSSVGRNEAALAVEATKESQVILQAQSLSVATYGNAEGDCAYGVLFNVSAQTYSLFAYNPPAGARPANGGCPSAASTTMSMMTPSSTQLYTEGTWNIPVANGVVLSSANGYKNDNFAVLFYPPDPQTLLSPDGKTFPLAAQTQSLTFNLKTVDGASSQVISVSPSGQVSF